MKKQKTKKHLQNLGGGRRSQAATRPKAVKCLTGMRTARVCVRVCVCVCFGEEESKQEWNDDPLISHGATSALGERTASYKKKKKKKSPPLFPLPIRHSSSIPPAFIRPLLAPQPPHHTINIPCCASVSPASSAPTKDLQGLIQKTTGMSAVSIKGRG